MFIPSNILKMVLVLSLTFLLLLGISFLVIEPDSEAFVVATLALVANLLILILVGVVLVLQQRYAKEV